ncbi:hypothetical protein [Nonomuraea sp. B19D2]|uniref:hypothetical protein n=1 Tax=Nonomuraea sp. B19D2 TaxID=3159561 RepID=UPI0032DA55FF
MNKTNEPAGGDTQAVYTCRLPVSTKTLTFVTSMLREHLRPVLPVGVPVSRQAGAPYLRKSLRPRCNLRRLEGITGVDDPE